MKRILYLFAIALCWELCAAEPIVAQTRKTGGPVATSGLFQSMQSTGMPALIIAGSTGCVYCVEMSEELSSNAKLQPLVQQMFVAKVDVSSRDWPILRDTFKFEESGIPAVFFVRADGELLYSDAGKPFDMEGFLKEQLAKSGKLLDAKTLKLMSRDAKQVDLAIKRKDLEKAAQLVKEYAGSGSYAAAALAFDKAGAQLVELAATRSKEVSGRLEDPKTQFAAALDLVELQATLATYEPARKVVADAIVVSQVDENVEKLYEDAEQLLAARKAEAAKQWKVAVEGYTIAARSLLTEAGKEYAAERVRMLQPRVKG